MLDAIDTIELEKTRVEIYQDENPESPREWDNLGTMVCSHRKYDLGDEQTRDLYQWMLDHVADKLSERQYDYFYDKEDHIKLLDIFQQDNFVLPLYLYDHSGITMSTSHSYPYNDIWDAGQVGFIFVLKQAVKKEWGWKHITSKRAKQILDYLRGEVEIYDQYLIGDIYGYKIFCNICGDELDSCWGFYGSNWKENGLMESATGAECESCGSAEAGLERVLEQIGG